MVVHAYNPSTREAERGGQPELYSETLFHIKERLSSDLYGQQF
jgi:hypothetical protein